MLFCIKMESRKYRLPRSGTIDPAPHKCQLFHNEIISLYIFSPCHPEESVSNFY